MDEPIERTPLAVCHRCLQPVPPQAPTCPHCGDPQGKPGKLGTLVVMVGLLLAVLVAFFVILRLTQAGGATTPAPEVSLPQEQQDAPQELPPPEPQPKPALGQ
jgi:hypothetical protein